MLHEFYQLYFVVSSSNTKRKTLFTDKASGVYLLHPLFSTVFPRKRAWLFWNRTFNKIWFTKPPNWKPITLFNIQGYLTIVFPLRKHVFMDNIFFFIKAKIHLNVPRKKIHALFYYNIESILEHMKTKFYNYYLSTYYSYVKQ